MNFFPGIWNVFAKRTVVAAKATILLSFPSLTSLDARAAISRSERDNFRVRRRSDWRPSNRAEEGASGDSEKRRETQL